MCSSVPLYNEELLGGKAPGACGSLTATLPSQSADLEPSKLWALSPSALHSGKGPSVLLRLAKQLALPCSFGRDQGVSANTAGILFVDTLQGEKTSVLHRRLVRRRPLLVLHLV